MSTWQDLTASMRPCLGEEPGSRSVADIAPDTPPDARPGTDQEPDGPGGGAFSCTSAVPPVLPEDAPLGATSRAVVDLGAVAHNARVLARAARRPWMAVVKADAYGHGLGPVATTCLAAGASWLGVAQLSEALRLRELLDGAGIARPQPGPDTAATHRAPRLLTWITPVLTPQEAAGPGSPLRAALAADADLSVSTASQVRALAAAARAQEVVARVHLKVDTGMSRGGAAAEDLPNLAATLCQEERRGSLVVVGLWSHLSRADEPGSGSTQDHLTRFRAGEVVVRDAGLRPRVRHLAATAGILWHPSTHLDLVRVGIGLYGLSPDPHQASGTSLGLRPAMRLEAPLVQVKRIARGQAVSYGGTWVAPTSRWVGLVPLGYSDGLPRAASSCGPVWVGGHRTTVVGRVCMDQVVVDLGPAAAPDGAVVPAPAAEGDTAVLWGDPSSQEVCGAPVPTVDEWAQACGTINYEVVTRLGPRVPRHYLTRAS